MVNESEFIFSFAHKMGALYAVNRVCGPVPWHTHTNKHRAPGDHDCTGPFPSPAPPGYRPPSALQAPYYDTIRRRKATCPLLNLLLLTPDQVNSELHIYADHAFTPPKVANRKLTARGRA